MTKSLDVLTLPLKGINLVEASAGTGKTWTITALYVRLLLECDLTVDRILVVTYTRAATAELRDRIRSLLTGVYEGLRNNIIPETDEFLRELIRTWVAAPKRGLALRKLSTAISNFDQAAIYTIHGFCQRALSVWALETNTPIGSEVLADERDLIQEAADDFWRLHLYNGPIALVDFLNNKKIDFASYLKVIRSHVDKPYLEVTGPTVPSGLPELMNEYDGSYHKARALWKKGSDHILSLLLKNDLKANIYSKDKLEGPRKEMDLFFAPETSHGILFEKFDFFTYSKIEKSTKKDGKSPTHQFYELCDRLQELHEPVFAQKIRHLPIEFFEFCAHELPKRRGELGVCSYNDLLNQLAEALECETGENHLAAALHSCYGAALIDEFQDTDPMQYQIFDSIYKKTDCPVFLVGDPKQAIYGFRGADIFTYIRAKQVAASTHTLNTCRRSTPQLVSAFEALFKDHPLPFMLDLIPYHLIKADPIDNRLLSMDEAENKAPMRFWWMESNDGDLINKGIANKTAADATASEIARLLNLAASGRATLGNEPLSGGDIAVLVPTHRQAGYVRDALRARDIPAVQYGQGNVYETHEAGELLYVLEAIADPSDESKVQTALATELMGMSGEGLYGLTLDEAAWEERLDKFREYRDLWIEHGFARAFRAWLENEHVPERLLGSFEDGERRLTNVLHLGELLGKAAMTEVRSIESLTSWFAEYCRDPEPNAEEELLRLESDSKLVKLITVHSAKGLQYPIVFCPFLWDGHLWNRGEEKMAVLYHDPADVNTAKLSLGSPSGDEVRRGEFERLAEKVRLLYVALTRAKRRCYTIWGKINECETSGMAWLFHGAGIETDPNPSESLKDRVKTSSPSAMRARLDEIAQSANGAIVVEPIRVTEEKLESPLLSLEKLQAREFARRLESSWKMTSYTSLARSGDVEGKDHDARLTSVRKREENPDALGIFSFPGGARTGSCLHSLFEEWDLSNLDRGALTEHVRLGLRRFGIEEQWVPAAVEMMENVLGVPLDGISLRLAGINPGQRVTEMEFLFPLQSGEAFLKTLTDPANGLALEFRNAAESLNVRRLNGFMKGFIDIVFEAGGRYFIADYKSNRLGSSIEDYAPGRLLDVMAAEHYYLQYLIYTIAIHRYLAKRIPGYDYDRHFGGGFYIFLRGVRSADGNSASIYHDRPSRALVEAIDRGMRGEP